MPLSCRPQEGGWLDLALPRCASSVTRPKSSDAAVREAPPMGARPEEDSKLLPGDSGSVRDEVMLEVEDTRSKEAELELLLLETDRQVLSRCGEEERPDERLEDGLEGGS